MDELEEIKQGWSDGRGGYLPDDVSWLIAEVERLRVEFGHQQMAAMELGAEVGRLQEELDDAEETHDEDLLSVQKQAHYERVRTHQENTRLHQENADLRSLLRRGA